MTSVRASICGTLFTVMAIASCGSGDAVPAPATPDAAASEAPPRDPPRFGASVSEPKDARGVDACDLITDAQLTELGLIADSFRETPNAITRSCSWSSAVDPVNPAGLELNDDLAIPVLDGLYLRQDSFANFVPLEVAGHPAIRTDYNDDGQCTITTVISDYQGVTTEGNPAGRPQPDPCALSIRMAEAILSNLPPLTEE